MDQCGKLYVLWGEHIGFVRVGCTTQPPDAVFQHYSRLYTWNITMMVVHSSHCQWHKRQFAYHFSEHRIQGNLYSEAGADDYVSYLAMVCGTPHWLQLTGDAAGRILMQQRLVNPLAYFQRLPDLRQVLDAAAAAAAGAGES